METVLGPEMAMAPDPESNRQSWSSGSKPVSFDEFLKGDGNQAEFDRRVQKAYQYGCHESTAEMAGSC